MIGNWFKKYLSSLLALTTMVIFLPTFEISPWQNIFFAAFLAAFLFIVMRPIMEMVLFPFKLVTMGLSNIILTTVLFYLLIFFIPGIEVKPSIIFDLRLGFYGSLTLHALVYSIIYKIIRIVI